MPEDGDDDVDVDSLFDGIDSEAGEAEKKVHAAITMRPLGIKKNDPQGAANRFAAAQRSDLLKAGMTAKTGDADIQMTALGGAAVVLGVASRTAGGVVSTAGAMNVQLEERAAYLARLAAMVGEELGLETLRELHLGGVEKRLAWVARPDGSASTIVADRETDMSAVGRKLRR